MREDLRLNDLSPHEAAERIRSMIQGVGVTGAFDSEPSQLNNLVKLVEAKEISPADALKQAENIINFRQEDH